MSEHSINRTTRSNKSEKNPPAQKKGSRESLAMHLDPGELQAAFKCSAIFANDDDEEIEYERDSSKWPVKAIELMISHRLRLQSAFHSPKYTKNKLWDTISEYLQEAGFNFDGKECHLKYRNMLATYKKNAEKVNTYGEECIKWKWFSVFHNVLQCNQNFSDEQPNASIDVAAKEEDGDGASRGEVKPKDKKGESQASTSKKYNERSETPESEFRKWSRSAVNLLLVLRHQYNDVFNDPSAHKVKYWRKIAKILRESGYDVSDRDCIVKWHNLINTFRSNLRKSQNEPIRWEWFDLMSQILNQLPENGKTTPVSTIIHNPINSPSADHGDTKTQDAQQHKNIPNSDQHSNTVIIPSEDEVDVMKDTLSMISDYDPMVNDTGSLDDIVIDDGSLNEHQSKRSKRYQKSYWKEKIKLQKAAEHRRKREWSERKQIELQKINLKKQKLRIYHRLTKTLEKLAASGVMKDLLKNDKRL